MARNTGIHGLIAGLAGGGIFLFFLFALSFPFLVALGSGIAAFVVALLFFRIEGKDTKQTSGRTALTADVIRSGKVHQDAMNALAGTIPPGEIARRMKNLARLTGKIVDNVKADPKDAPLAGRFLDYYADAAVKIGRMYVDLAVRGLSGATAVEIGTKVLKNLATLETAFESHLQKLQEDNLLNLDTELTVLEKTMLMEGIVQERSDEGPAKK